MYQSYTAEDLNQHFSKQSTDSDYTSTNVKFTANPISGSSLISEYQIFLMLDKLKSTAAGPDEIPFWFLKIASPSISLPLSYLFNLSFQTGIVPHQWKNANIVPIPKVPCPSSPSDFRPILLTPIISRLFERVVVKTNIYTLFFNPTLAALFSDQYAFRPFGSTDAAIISIIHHVTSLLSDGNSYVRLIGLDFSKAFDTVKHSCILSKLSSLPISDQLYNWLVNYFQGHSHTTRFNSTTSSTAKINASVFQGSAIGPSLFVINGIDLKPVHKENYIDKYADDSYLITSS